MIWIDLKEAIRADLLGRGLKQPRLRISALDRLEEFLSQIFPESLVSPALLLSIGRDNVSAKLARLKDNGRLNGAERSVLGDIFRRLDE